MIETAIQGLASLLNCDAKLLLLESGSSSSNGNSRMYEVVKGVKYVGDGDMI